MPVESTTPEHVWRRLDGVDILRGLAIFFVLMNHVNMRLWGAKIPYTKGLPHQLVSSLVWNGQFGVQIFFVISGFLITSPTLRRWGSPSSVNVRDFYLLRFARIAPLLLLLLAVLSGLHLAHINNFVVSQKTGGLRRALLAAVTFHINLLEARRDYLPGNWDILWSLSIEEMFYLFFPLVARLFGRGKLLIALLLGFAALGPFARTVFTHGSEIWKEYSYLGGMDAIALGCLTALASAQFPLSRGALRGIAAIGATLAIFILCFPAQPANLALERAGLDMTVLALGTCALVVAAAQTNWKSPRVLRPLLLLGQYSYEVYLTHMFVVFALFHLFLRSAGHVAAVPVLFLSVIAVSGLLGGFVARTFSEPVNQFIRIRWRSPRQVRRPAEWV